MAENDGLKSKSKSASKKVNEFQDRLTRLQENNVGEIQCTYQLADKL
jgi:hypothetical protein